MFVNGEYVDDELIRIEAARLREQLHAEIPAATDLEIGMRAQDWARENVIQRVLLESAARQDRDPIPIEEIESAIQEYYERDSRHAKCMLPRDHESLRASIELDLRIERLTNRITANVPRPKPSEIKSYYDQNKRSFYMPELVHAAHIVKNVDETIPESDALVAIRAAKDRLAMGANFEELADELSDCPGRGGDLGFFQRGEMVEQFEDVVFIMAPGEVSDTFRSPFGFHIVKLYERAPAQIRLLNEVRPEIEKMLWEQKRREALRSYIGDLRSRADIRKSKPANSRQGT